jgi:tetratricopeptide (TPR) repeat protein
MFLIALMLAAQEAPPPVQAEVVITGNRMRDALEKCLARGCPPEEEVDAAMSAAGESFAAGRYEEAKAMLRKAIARNKQYAQRMPGRMSDLYATYADVAEHEGDNEAFRSATRDSVDVLRSTLGPKHPTVVRVSQRVGDMWVKLGNPASADSAYREAADDAKRAGNGDMAAALTFRRAWLALSTGNLTLSRRLLAQIEASHGADARFAGVLAVLRARIAILRGDEDATDALVAALRNAGGAEPVLLKEEPYPAFASGMSSGVNATGGIDISAARNSQLRDSEEILWADIGFWVRPDGKTAEVEILRPVKDGYWAKPLVKHIQGRRYVPAKQGGDGLGTYRVERFTLRPSQGVPTGSRIARRMGERTLHMVDLTRLSQRDSAPPGGEGSP